MSIKTALLSLCTLKSDETAHLGRGIANRAWAITHKAVIGKIALGNLLQ